MCEEKKKKWINRMGKVLSVTMPQERDANELFQEDYMDDLMASKPAGADDPQVRKAMVTLQAPNAGDLSDDEVNKQLEIIRKQTNAQKDSGSQLSQEQFRAHYDKFKDIKAKAGNVESIHEKDHPEFVGSTTHLRFGKVVGDHFGIDPVFGALLNPTGGIPGEGNKAAPGAGIMYDPDNPEDPVVKHGVMHDAAGYLYNKHGKKGPGYDYLGTEKRDTGDPYVGQSSGINYWIDKSDRTTDKLLSLAPDLDPRRQLAELPGYLVDVKKATGVDLREVYADVKKGVEEKYEFVEEKAGQAFDWGKEKLAEGEQAVKDGYNRLEEGYNELEEGYNKLEEKYDQFEKDAEEYVEQKVEEGEEYVKQKAQEMKDVIADKASDVAEGIEDAAEATTDAAGDAYDYASDKASKTIDYLTGWV